MPGDLKGVKPDWLLVVHLRSDPLTSHTACAGVRPASALVCATGYLGKETQAQNRPAFISSHPYM